jgi:hypothetical protein
LDNKRDNMNKKGYERLYVFLEFYDLLCGKQVVNSKGKYGLCDPSLALLICDMLNCVPCESG